MKKYLLLFLFPISFLTAQNITTIAGNGSNEYNGDNILAIDASISLSGGLRINPNGELIIADLANRIRKVNNSGIITTIAGTGVGGYNASNNIATQTPIQNPYSPVYNNLGNLIFCDFNNSRIRKIDPSGIITTIAGTGGQSYTGDNGLAINAQIGFPSGLAIDLFGNLYFVVGNHHRVRKIDTSGIITTIAGVGTAGFSGDGGFATNAQLNFPAGVAIDNQGNIYITESTGQRIRKIDSSGIITTIAGTGIIGYNGDNISALIAKLHTPIGITCDTQGNLYFADANNHRIRKINSAGVITTICGVGTPGYNGDNIPPDQASLNYPTAVTFGTDGSMYIADSFNYRVRKIANLLANANFTIDESDIVLAPNPTSNKLTTISFPDSTELIKVYNIDGRLICSYPVIGLVKLDMQFDIPGVYLVKTVCRDMSVTKKLLVSP